MTSPAARRQLRLAVAARELTAAEARLLLVHAYVRPRPSVSGRAPVRRESSASTALDRAPFPLPPSRSRPPYLGGLRMASGGWWLTRAAPSWLRAIRAKRPSSAALGGAPLGLWGWPWPWLMCLSRLWERLRGPAPPALGGPPGRPAPFGEFPGSDGYGTRRGARSTPVQRPLRRFAEQNPMCLGAPLGPSCAVPTEA